MNSKRTIAATIVISAALLLSMFLSVSIQTSSAATNLIQNGGFETGISPWYLDIYNPGSAGYVGSFTSSTDAHSGTYSSLFTVAGLPIGGGGYVIFVQNIQLPAGQKYTLQFYYKGTLSVASNAYCYDSSNNQVGAFYNSVLPTATTWTLATMTIGPIPSGAVTTSIHFDPRSTGAFQIDDVQLIQVASPTPTPTSTPTPAPTPPPNIITNGGFETGIAPWILDIYNPNNVGYAGTFAQSTDAHSGIYSGTFKVLGLPTGGSGYVIFAQNMQLFAGQTYTLQFYYKGAISIGPDIYYLSPSGSNGAVFGPNLASASSWTLAAVTFGPVPSGTTTTSLHFDTTSAGTFQIDDVQLTVASSPTPTSIPTGTPSPTPKPTATPTSTLSPTPTPSSTPGSTIPPNMHLKIGVSMTTPYDYSELSAATIASASDLSISWYVLPSNTQFDQKLAAVLAIDPNHTFLMYRNAFSISDSSELTLAKSSGWVLKDANGNYVQEVSYSGNYMVDITNPVYQQWLANLLSTWLTQHPLVNGIFLDNGLLFGATSINGAASSKPINPSTGTYFTDLQVQNGYVSLLNTIINKIGTTKILMANGVWNGDVWSSSAGNGYRYELTNTPALNALASEGTFMTWNPTWYPVWAWKESVDFCVWAQQNFLTSATKMFEPYCISTVLPPGATQQQVVEFGVSSLLLAANSNSQNDMGFSIDFSKSASAVALAQKIRALDMIAPLGAYYQISSTQVFARDFVKGKVLVNPSSTPYTVNIGGSYSTFDGLKVSSSMTIPAYTGVILLS
jgi:hypothetical protein